MRTNWTCANKKDIPQISYKVMMQGTMAYKSRNQTESSAKDASNMANFEVDASIKQSVCNIQCMHHVKKEAKSKQTYAAVTLNHQETSLIKDAIFMQNRQKGTCSSNLG